MENEDQNARLGLTDEELIDVLDRKAVCEIHEPLHVPAEIIFDEDDWDELLEDIVTHLFAGQERHKDTLL